MKIPPAVPWHLKNRKHKQLTEYMNKGATCQPPPPSERKQLTLKIPQ